MTTLILYVPVIHQGYLRVVEAVRPTHILLINKDNYLDVFPELKKDIRAVAASTVQNVLSGLYPDISISIFDPLQLKSVGKVVATNDELSRHVVERYCSQQPVQWHSAFLRWDKERILKPQPVIPDNEVLAADFWGKLRWEASHSSDWWRQVAAAIVQNEEITVIAHNTHRPSEHEPYFQGDARSFFHKGEYVEVNTALHAEAAVIGAAAKRGQSLAGASLYVTTFPCPYCARLVAETGIKEVCFYEGYSMLDGVEYLKQAGITLIQVND